MAQNDLNNKLAAFKQTTQQAAKVTDATSTLVTTKAKDTLLVVDGYGKTAKDTLTNMKNDIQGRIAAAKNWLFNTEIGDLGSLNEALATANAVKKDVAALNQQLSDAVNGTVSTVRGISSGVLNAAQDQLSVLNKIPFDTVTNGKGGVLRVLLGATVPEINNLVDMTKRFVPNLKSELNRYEDLYAQTALKVSLLGNAAGLGMTEVIDRVMETDPNNVVLKTALIDQFDTAIRNGDLSIINSILNNLGVEYTLGRYPNAVQEILQNYRMPLGTTAVDYPAAAAALLTTVQRFDPTWDKLAGYPQFNNLSVFTLASEDTRLAFGTLPDYQRLMAVARHYSPLPLKTELKQMYRYALL